MSNPARFHSHAERARRRAAIRRALRAGRKPSDLAREYGLTRRYVCQIAQDAGLSSCPGRPKGSRWWHDCPTDLIDTYDFLTRRKRLPVAEIRQMLEAA